LEAELRADQDQLEASLKEVRSELQQEREKSVSAAHKCVEIESKLEADAASALAADTERQQRLEQAQDQYNRDSEAWNAEKISLDDRLRKAMDALTTEGANSAALGGEVKVLREMVAAGEERVASLEASLLRVQDDGRVETEKLLETTKVDLVSERNRCMELEAVYAERLKA
jgi:predicted  nucleic acid-binding Zn-ribbon protein